MTTASLMARAHDGVVEDPDPAARPRRHTFTAEYKARILDEKVDVTVRRPVCSTPCHQADLRKERVARLAGKRRVHLAAPDPVEVVPGGGEEEAAHDDV